MDINCIKNYIYTYKESLSQELCKDIINLFEQEKNVPGTTRRGFTPTIKNTMDFDILNCHSNNNWTAITKLLHAEIQRHFIIYKELTFNLFSNTKFSVSEMNIQKYNKNDGFYKYHVDELIDYTNNKSRTLVFMWYLNDIVDGGETEFWEQYRIKPETGKFVFFPATWTFPHTALPPLSCNKYIITGWLWNHSS